MGNPDTWYVSILFPGFQFHTARRRLNRKSLGALMGIGTHSVEEEMATTQTTRGRNQDRAKVAGGQDHEVEYEAGKTGASKADVKSAVKSAGNSRKKVEDKLGKR
jgi:Protein of unknown function (DUF3606)